MKSKMLSLFLVLCLILSCFPVSVMAAQSQSNEDLVSVIGLSYDGLEYGYHDCSTIVKNNTDTTISSLSVAFVFMNDEHTIVSVSYGAGDTRIRPGQSITLTASVPEDTPATSFNVDCCMFVDETGQNSICYFNSVPKNYWHIPHTCSPNAGQEHIHRFGHLGVRPCRNISTVE